MNSMSDNEVALSASSNNFSSNQQQPVSDEERATHTTPKEEEEQAGNEERRQLTGFKVRFSLVQASAKGGSLLINSSGSSLSSAR